MAKFSPAFVINQAIKAGALIGKGWIDIPPTQMGDKLPRPRYYTGDTSRCILHSLYRVEGGKVVRYDQVVNNTFTGLWFKAT